MAGKRDIQAGRASVTLSLRNQMEQGLRGAQRQLKSFGSAIAQVGAVTAGLGVALAAPMLAFTKAAGDAAETLSRFKAVFGDQSAAAEKFADDLSKAVGRSANDIKASMADFQAFGIGLGFDPTEARAMSQTLAELSIDFASFNNLSDEEAAGRFISALSGSRKCSTVSESTSGRRRLSRNCSARESTSRGLKSPSRRR